MNKVTFVHKHTVDSTAIFRRSKTVGKIGEPLAIATRWVPIDGFDAGNVHQGAVLAPNTSTAPREVVR